ncbi:MAG: hypothetical protein V7724_06990 [Sediminicola sp.]
MKNVFSIFRPSSWRRTAPVASASIEEPNNYEGDEFEFDFIRMIDQEFDPDEVE